jgi:hypothetical protein
MLNKNLIKCLLMTTFLCIPSTLAYAQGGEDGLGQTIQITTRFSSFVGKPSWLFIIRDLDHDQNIPYFFEIKRGDNFWLAFTYSRNYLISVSNMQIETYQSRYNKFKNYKISNFCHLESNGHILKGESVFVTIGGDLTPNSDTYTCHVSKYKDVSFPIVSPDSAAQ